MKVLVSFLVSFLVTGCANVATNPNENNGEYVMDLDCNLVWCNDNGCHEYTQWDREDIRMCRALDW